ncbi:MAG: hypothetical protein H7Y37_09060 [Anaerolineae bacterium]|nr:hypothetical protein [Gloeobacterales cyanobacterium ES-bin-313]
MLKRAALMLLVVPVQMFNFSLARNFLHGLHSHSQVVISEEIQIRDETPCLHSETTIVEQGRVLHFSSNGQINVESSLSENGDEEITNDLAPKVDVAESACSEEGCENP